MGTIAFKEAKETQYWLEYTKLTTLSNRDLNSHNWIRRQNILSTAQTIYESRQILSA